MKFLAQFYLPLFGQVRRAEYRDALDFATIQQFTPDQASLDRLADADIISDQQAYRIAFLIAGFLQDRLSPEERAERGSYVGCIAGALSKAEYEAGLESAGFVDVSVEFTHEVADGMHGAIVKAAKPRPA